ncbi:MAG: HAMP domain-containing sensor histidine kinase [Actinomycetota bacterium]|nr:HAMP domain-containing sensor histidine kinase [Actinomycetota bacterium]
MNIKRSLVKLTLFYLILIMLVSGFLSYMIYEFAPRPLERRIELGEDIFVNPPPERYSRHYLMPEAVTEVKRRIGLSLIYFNIAVLLFAGFVSYTLAKRELRPLERAIELQNRFTSDAAHELRTPLTAMKTEIEVALREENLPGEIRELLESNNEEIDKLVSLSSSLLKLAQYEEGEAERFGCLDLAEVVEGAVSRVKHFAEAKSIDITVQVEETSIKGDSESLTELFVVLLDNAIKYSDEGKRIDVFSLREKGKKTIFIKDEGYGIDEEDVEKVFERFYRGRMPRDAEPVSGYGLGLSIAKRIAELHHARIRLGSEPGAGTTAIVEFRH